MEAGLGLGEWPGKHPHHGLTRVSLEKLALQVAEEQETP